MKIQEYHTPKLSIICPVFNGEAVIGDALRSVKEQKFQDWELIVVNDGSEDDTASLLEEEHRLDSRIKIFNLKTNVGVSKARNIGIKESAAPYVCFLDADDAYLGPNSLLDRMKHLCQPDFEYEGVFCHTEICDKYFYPLGLALRGQPILTFEHILTHPIHVNSMIIKRELLNNIQFEEDQRNGEDWLFLSRLLRQGNRLQFVETDGLSYRWLPNSVTHNDFVAHEDALEDVIRTFLASDEKCNDPKDEWKNGLDGYGFSKVWHKRRSSVLIYLLLQEDWSRASSLANELSDYDIDVNMQGFMNIQYPAMRFFKQPCESALACAFNAFQTNIKNWQAILSSAGLEVLFENIAVEGASFKQRVCSQDDIGWDLLLEENNPDNLAGISVIICTHNGQSNLQAVLESVIAQKCIPASKLEVIIVLNGCSDNSERVASELLSQGTLEYKIVKEDELGLSFARNRGIQEASFDYIAFIDDDTYLDHNWVAAISRAFYETNSDIIGGRVSLWFRDGEEPRWLHHFHKRLLGHNDHGKGRLYNKVEYIFGCNFAVKKSIFDRVDTFGRQFGRVGQSRGAGEEAELAERALEAGFKLHYEPSAHLKHLVTRERLQIEYLSKCAYGAGTARAYFPSVKKIFNSEYFYDVQAMLLKVQHAEATAEKNSDDHKYLYCRKQEILGHLQGCLDQSFSHKFGEAPVWSQQPPPSSYLELKQEVYRLTSAKTRSLVLDTAIESLVKELPLKRFIFDEQLSINLADQEIKPPFTLELLLLTDPSSVRPFEPYGPHTPPMPFLCEPFALYQIEHDLLQVKLGTGGQHTKTFPCKSAWVHIALTVDENSHSTVYADGENILEVTLDTPPVMKHLSLGKGYAERYWDGWFKALQIVPEVLYDGPFQPPQALEQVEFRKAYFDGSNFITKDKKSKV